MPRKPQRAGNRPRAQAKVASKPVADAVPDSFAGMRGVLLATGPSLTREQVEYIRPLHEAGDIAVFGLNDAYRWCDFLDVFYFCDPRWLTANSDALDYSHGEIWTQDANLRTQHAGKIKRVAGTSGNGICKQANHIHFGGNSGFQLLNLAWHFGIRDFYLLGYNMDVPPGKKQHMFGPHPRPLNQAHNYKGFVGAFKNIHANDRALITNCTYPSALVGFKKQPLEEALSHDKTRHVRIKEPAPETRRAARPRKETPVFAAVPIEGRRTNLGGEDGSVDRNRTEPVRVAVVDDQRRAYGG